MDAATTETQAVIRVLMERVSRAEDARDEARRETISMAKRLEAAEVKISTTYVECGCSRRYTPEEFKALGVKRQLVEDEGTLLLANCACGSTISMQEAWGGA